MKFSVCLLVIDKIRENFILGQYILKSHEPIHIRFGGSEAPLKVCSEASAANEPPKLFKTLRAACKPIADQFSYYSETDQSFISE